MENIILGCLSIQPMNSYSLKQFIANSVNSFSEVSFGTLYPALSRLQKKGYVNMKIENGKKIYHITETGEVALNNWLESKEAKFKMNYEFLTKLFFFGLLDQVQVRENILIHMREIEQEKKMMKEVLEKHQGVADRYQQMTIEFAIDFYTFLGKWYQDFLVELGKNK